MFRSGIVSEVLEELCTQALIIGMPYDLFWKSGFVEYYIYLNKYKQEHQQRYKEINYQSWLNGLYIYHALLDVSPLLNGFAKNPKAHDYFKKPLQSSEEKKEEMSPELKEEAIALTAYMQYSMINAIEEGKRIKEGEQNGE